MAKRPIKTKRTPINTGNTPKKFQGTKKRTQLQDVRFKLIQRKRKNVVDARDVLARMAKSQDARNKLNRIRDQRKRGGGSGVARSKQNVRVIGAHIVQKTDRNGKISLLTNKTGPTTGMNTAIRKELGLAAMKKMNETIIRHTPRPRPPAHDYHWTTPGVRVAASQLIGSFEANRRLLKQQQQQQQQRLVADDWTSYPIATIDYDDAEMPLVAPIKPTITLQGSSRISNVHARLDAPAPHPIEQESHGIFAQPKTKVVVPAGHRIVVSNLQPTVTQDDVKELFEDIGQLLAARLVRTGVAEVIYKNLKDAQKAVDTYHNRQLDGQPMKCLLVNKRPVNNPTGAPYATNKSILLAKENDALNSNSNKLVPDISTFHKVLFQRK